MKTITLHLLKDGTPVQVIDRSLILGPDSEWAHAHVRFQNENGDMQAYLVEETIPEIKALLASKLLDE